MIVYILNSVVCCGSVYKEKQGKQKLLFIALYYKQLSVDIKMKNYEFKTSFVNPEWQKVRSNKTGINFMINISPFGKISIK